MRLKDFLLFALVAIFSMAGRSFVALKFYGWFVMSAFNAPVLNYGQMVGLMMTYNFINFKISSSQKDPLQRDHINDLFLLVGAYSILLQIGYLFHLLLIKL